MSKYSFIKSRLEIAEQLRHLWDNYNLYRFIMGTEGVRKQELEIAECLFDRDDYIEVCRIIWLQQQLERIKKQP